MGNVGVMGIGLEWLSEFARVHLLPAVPSTIVAGLVVFGLQERMRRATARQLEAQRSDVLHAIEDKKAELQRQLEAYKVTLIASVEHQKAQAELKKALAVKHATLEYEAIAALHGAIGAATALTLARATSQSPSSWEPRERIANHQEVQAAQEALSIAVEQARIFLGDSELSVCMSLRSVLLRLAVERILKGDGPASLEALEPVMTACTSIQKLLKRRVSELTTIRVDAQT